MYGEIKTEILANYAKRGKIISEKSIDKYLNDIKKIQSLLGDLGEVDDLSFLYNFNDVLLKICEVARSILTLEKR